jgi:hypothetical protein
MVEKVRTMGCLLAFGSRHQAGLVAEAQGPERAVGDGQREESFAEARVVGVGEWGVEEVNLRISRGWRGRGGRRSAKAEK